MIRVALDGLVSSDLPRFCQRTFLLKVFCKWPTQQGHFVKIWVGHVMDPMFRGRPRLALITRKFAVLGSLQNPKLKVRKSWPRLGCLIQKFDQWRMPSSSSLPCESRSKRAATRYAKFHRVVSR